MTIRALPRELPPWTALALLGLCAGLVCSDAGAQTITRGPYLQKLGPSEVTIRWRTDVPTQGEVRFGLAGSASTAVATTAQSGTEHEVELSNLAPQTRYTYAVGVAGVTTPLAGGAGDCTFQTAPPRGVETPTRIWVLGDAGRANSNQARVRDAFLAFTGARPPDLWLMLGDNAYNTGTDSEYQEAVFEMYPWALRTASVFSTRGNHDTLSTGGLTYYDHFTLPTAGELGGLASGTEAYYSFDYGDIHLICLDSQGTSRSLGGPMLTWLESDLSLNQREWTIAFWHHPPYTKGSHNSDTESRLIDMRENVLPLLEQGGCDLVLSGHSHAYERSFLIDAHYGLSSTFSAAHVVDGGDGDPVGDGAYRKLSNGSAAHEGSVYVVAGSSGAVSSSGSLDHPAMSSSQRSLGSLVIDVDGPSLRGSFVDDHGAVLDRFELRKGGVFDGSPPTVLLAARIDTQTIEVALSEPLDPASATDPGAYSLTHGVSVLSATLRVDGQSVTLTTSTLNPALPTQLTLAGVMDVTGNAMPPTQVAIEGFSRPQGAIPIETTSGGGCQFPGGDRGPAGLPWALVLTVLLAAAASLRGTADGPLG